MDTGILIGRILLIAMFVASGCGKFADLSGTTAMIAGKGLAQPQLVAIAAGTVEVVGGLLIAVGFLTRYAAVALMIFTALAAYFFHDFWNQTGPEHAAQMIHAWKNLSIIGGLIVLAFAGP